MKIDLSEDTISMFLGLMIVVLVVLLVINYVRRNKGNIEVPGISSNQENLAETEKGKYTVVKGDSLWKIAESTLGSGFKWVEISRVNNLQNPDLIFSGQELKMPEVETVRTEPVNGEYVVDKGDSLWKISVNLYKDGYKWVKLWEANKAKIADPDLIEIGMKLAKPQL